MKKLLFAAAAVSLLAAPAFAKRHCVDKDGNEVADAANRKECKAKGGKWKKEAKHDAKHEDAKHDEAKHDEAKPEGEHKDEAKPAEGEKKE